MLDQLKTTYCRKGVLLSGFKFIQTNFGGNSQKYVLKRHSKVEI